MRKFGSALLGLARAAVVVAMAALCAPIAAQAQVVQQLPQYIDNSAVLDLGNGPLEIKVMSGNAALFTSQSSGVASTSGSSTTLTLVSTPTTANAPCIGCVISSTAITAGTTVVAYDGGLKITLSAAMTVGAGTAVAWGVACPASLGAIRAMLVQSGVGGDIPMYTYARICGAAPNAPGATLLSFPIGAH